MTIELSGESLSFRRAEVADVAEIQEIRLAVTENRLNNPARVTRQMCIDYLDEFGRGWVCEQGGRIIGFSYAAKADASIWALFVRPDCEGRGAGKALIKLATDWLFEQGHPLVTLGTEANTRADRFYQAQGWQRGEMKDAVEVLYTLRPSPTRA